MLNFTSFRRALMLTALATVLTAPVFAADDATGKVVSLRDAVAVGVTTNPEYGTIVNNRRATDEELVQAKGGFLPSIDVNADTGWEHTRNDPDGARASTDNLWRYQAGITLTQMLFDGYQTSYEVARQKARVASNSYRVWETSEFLGLGIVESYLNVLRQRELLTIARANIDRHVEISRQIIDSAQAGRVTEADVEQVKARLASARANEASVRESLRTSEATYLTKVGEMPRTLQRPAAPASLLSVTVDDEVKEALVGSPTLASREADIDTAAAEAKQSHATFYPKVDFQANANHANDTGGSEGDVDRARALVVMNWNLYRGGADTARTREGVYREAQAKETRADAGRKVEEDVRQTWARMISANERSREFQAQTDANGKVVDALINSIWIAVRFWTCSILRMNFSCHAATPSIPNIWNCLRCTVCWR
jgi:outer membrane protein, adhesin transport system